MEIVATFGACATCLKNLLKMVIFLLSPPWNFQRVDRYVLSPLLWWELGTDFPRSQVLVSDCHTGVSPVSCYSDSQQIHNFQILTTKTDEPQHDKTNKMAVCTAKTQISLGIYLPSVIRVYAVCMKKAWVLSYPLSAQRRLRSDWAGAQADHSEDSGQTGWMPRLIWVFAGRILLLLVLSCRSSDCLHFNFVENGLIPRLT